MADTDPQKSLKEVKQWLVLQRFCIGGAYSVALLMMLCAISNAEAHDISSTIIQGGLGTFNCYIGDKTRQRYVPVNKAYKECKKALKDAEKIRKNKTQATK